jgi:hypothetical protein
MFFIKQELHRMAYSDFTFDTLKSTFAFRVETGSLFNEALPVKAGDWLVRMFEHSVRMAQNIGTEKAKSEFIIAPILLEAQTLAGDDVSLFSGTEFNVDAAQGLKGFCDFIFTRSRNKILLEAPIITVVEAKNDNLNAALPQCIAEMIAAQMFNREHSPQTSNDEVFGLVTTGALWRFLMLRDTLVIIDERDYTIDALEKLLGILVHILQSK